LDYRPDWVLLPGDVNSTLACALVAGKLGVKVAHVEAGLRSFDRSMPEEINRLVTDQLSDLLLTPSRDGDENLLREGIPAEKIRFVGNVMIDTLVRLLPKAEARWSGLQERFGLDRYLLVTLHRPANVDDPATLGEFMTALVELSEQIPVVFPVHPRTRRRIENLGLIHPQFATGNLQFLDPLGYLDFLALEAHASLVLTDSGGVQEETTYLGVPCLTARPNTERPVTVTEGTNRLIAGHAQALAAAVKQTLEHPWAERPRPALWDGRTAERIVQAMQVRSEI
jgi:UDP-N-acetylglucosamine 2-epimerase (non-hydrolysing)